MVSKTPIATVEKSFARPCSRISRKKKKKIARIPAISRRDDDDAYQDEREEIFAGPGSPLSLAKNRVYHLGTTFVKKKKKKENEATRAAYLDLKKLERLDGGP